MGFTTKFGGMWEFLHCGGILSSALACICLMEAASGHLPRGRMCSHPRSGRGAPALEVWQRFAGKWATCGWSHGNGRRSHSTPQNGASRLPAILTVCRANRYSYPLRGFLNTRPWPGMIQSAMAKTFCRLASSLAWSQASGSVSGVISSSHQRWVRT